MRVHGEIEFEFREGDDGAGEFVACGQVVRTIRNYLNAGNIDEAARLLAACAENVGDDLIKEVSTGGVAPEAMATLAQMFFAAKDYGRAAQCAERSGNSDLTARCLEANYDLDHAASQYERAGDFARAAALYERNLNFARAAALYLQTSDLPRAAENLERVGNHFEAGELYVKMSRWDKAVEALQRVAPDNRRYVTAVQWLGHILEGTGNRQLAMQRYAEVVHGRPLNGETIDIHHRLAVLCLEGKHYREARQLLNGVLAFQPHHQAARQALDQLARSASQDESIEEIMIDVEPDAPSGPPPIPNVDIGQTHSIPGARLVGVDHDFNFLRQAPLFAQLSLEELKYVQSMCEKKRFASGEHLIVQGRPGDALYVLVRGIVAIDSVRADGARVTIGEVGPGAHLGEMSLLDDAPTSAHVVAKEEVTAFRLTKQRFSELLQANERIQLRIYTVMVNTLAKRLREANGKLAAATNSPAMFPG